MDVRLTPQAQFTLMIDVADSIKVVYGKGPLLRSKGIQDYFLSIMKAFSKVVMGRGHIAERSVKSLVKIGTVVWEYYQDFKYPGTAS